MNIEKLIEVTNEIFRPDMLVSFAQLKIILSALHVINKN